MNGKCEKHNLMRCGICEAAAAKGAVPQRPVAGPPPVAITGGPPENIEGLSVRDRLPQTPEEVNTDYDKILAEVNTLKANKEEKWESSAEEPTRPRVIRESFATLPTDDSHASKVMRAAAKYAEAARIYAVQLADTEKLKSAVSEMEAKLAVATAARVTAEEELKKLIMSGGTQC